MEDLPDWVRFEGETYRPTPRFQEIRFPFTDNDPYDYPLWGKSLEKMVSAVQKRGGKGRLELVAPATKEEVADVENHLRFALPGSFEE